MGARGKGFFMNFEKVVGQPKWGQLEELSTRRASVSSVGNSRTRRAVHRFDLWAGELSISGRTTEAKKNDPETGATVLGQAVISGRTRHEFIVFDRG